MKQILNNGKKFIEVTMNDVTEYGDVFDSFKSNFRFKLGVEIKHNSVVFTEKYFMQNASEIDKLIKLHRNFRLDKIRISNLSLMKQYMYTHRGIKVYRKKGTNMFFAEMGLDGRLVPLAVTKFGTVMPMYGLAFRPEAIPNAILVPGVLGKEASSVKELTKSISKGKLYL